MRFPLTSTRRRTAVRAAVVATAAAAFGLAMTGQSFASTPTTGWSTGAPTPVSQLTLPLTVDAAPDAAGIYFAYYTTLESGTRPYAGLQPKPQTDGQPRLQAVFSSFNAAATTDDDHCSYGADGGAGVSCAVQFDYTPGTEYDLVLKLASTTGDTQLMTGDVVEGGTGAAVAHIGSFSLPSTSGRFRASDGGFIEPYLTAGCSQQVTVTYGRPSGTEAGQTYTGGLPTVTDPASGSCLSTTAQDTPQGRQVTVTGDSFTG
ncbi:hypothetical protein [Actinacidiphila yeochonensis]|uniref:hypothetical protein n=1 Tax=Actinacidiphila yeochonensis TaxID=89050 RepID=UPI000690222A|nr:hypothetical protein [Actinacidiphila yeochonensis]